MSNHNRTHSREYAFQFLFHFQLPIFDSVKKEILSQEDDLMLEQTFKELEKSIPIQAQGDAKNFSITLIKEVMKNYYSLFKLIDDSLENWKIERISKVDLTILLMAACELKHLKETPFKVVINEAIELAKKFSTEESGPFINGILDKISKR